MRRVFLITLLGSLLCFPFLWAKAQEEETTQVSIDAPKPGEALQGRYPITGNTLIDDFLLTELEFAYSDHLTDTWFLIHESDQPVNNGVLVQWDTTRITDGIYDLRLTVHREQGNPIMVTVPGVRVRNYTPIETDTPTPVSSGTSDLDASSSGEGDLSSSMVTISPTSTSIPPSSTPLPPNPAEIVPSDISDSVLRGAAGVLAFFVLLGIYISVRRIFLS